MTSPIIPLHLGALHPVEQLLTFVLAFGPFVVLGIVIVLRRRADADEAAEGAGTAGTDGAEQHDEPAADPDRAPDPARPGVGTGADPTRGRQDQDR